MPPKSSVSIRISSGERWLVDLNHIEELRDLRPQNTYLDFYEFHDAIDIILDGMNLTSRIHSECVVPFFANLCEKTAEILHGSKKAIVEFHGEPWELVLVRKAKVLFISVLRVDRQMQVACLDHSIALTAFVNALIHSGVRILESLSSVSLRFSDHPLVRSLSKSIGELRKEMKQSSSTISEDTIGLKGSTNFPHFNISYESQDTHRLTLYDSEIVFDLHALLTAGEVELHFPQGSLVFNGYPFIIFSSLLRSTFTSLDLIVNTKDKKKKKDLLQFEVNHILSFSNLSDTPKIQVGKSSDFRLHFEEWVEVLLSSVEDFSEKVVQLQTSITTNQRFIDFLSELQKLKTKHSGRKENKKSKLDNEIKVLQQISTLKMDLPWKDEISFSHSFSKLRAFYPKRNWVFRDRHIRFSNILKIQDFFIIPAQHRLSCISESTGKVRWEMEVPEFHSELFLHQNSLLQQRDKNLCRFDIESGTLLSITEEPRNLESLHAYSSENLLVFSSPEGIIGRDLNSLDLRWFHNFEEGQTRLNGEGPVLAFLYSERDLQTHNGSLNALDPLTGQLIWEKEISGQPLAGPFYHRGHFVICTWDKGSRTLRLSAFSPLNGDLSWSILLEGTLAGPISFHEEMCMIPIERSGRVSIIGFSMDLESQIWSFDISSMGLDQPTPILCFGDRGILRSDWSEIFCFSLKNGKIIWRRNENNEFLCPNLPLAIVRDSFVACTKYLEIRSLKTGELIHEFGDTIIEPEYLKVFGKIQFVYGERCSYDPEYDQMISYSLEHFLGVV